MRWPWSPAEPEPATTPSPSPAPAPAVVQPSRAWASLPAIQRSAAGVSLSRPDAFAAGLSVRQVPPTVLAPLGHDVVLGAPSGLVDVEALRGAGRASGSPSPLPAPVQRRRRRGAAAAEPVSSPWLSDLGLVSYVTTAAAEPTVSFSADGWEPDTALALPDVVTPVHLDAPAASAPAATVAPVPVLRSALTSRPPAAAATTTAASSLPPVVVARSLAPAPAPAQRLGGASTPVEPRPLAPAAALDRPDVPVLRSTGSWTPPVAPEVVAAQPEPVMSTFADIPALLAAEATAPATSADAPVASPVVARRGIGEPRASLPARVQRQRLSDPDPVSPATVAFPSVSGAAPEPVSAPLTSAVPLPAREVPLLVSAPVAEAPSTTWSDEPAPALVSTAPALAPLVGATSLMPPPAAAPISVAREALDEEPAEAPAAAAAQAPGVPSVGGVPLPPELAALVGAATPRGSAPSPAPAPAPSGPATARPVPVLRSTSAPSPVGAPQAPLRVLPSVRPAAQDRATTAAAVSPQPAGSAGPVPYDPVDPSRPLPTLTTVGRSPLAVATAAPPRPAAVVSRWNGPSASQPQTTLQTSSLSSPPASVASSPAAVASSPAPVVQRAVEVDEITTAPAPVPTPAPTPAPAADAVSGADPAAAPATGAPGGQDPDAMAADLWERIRPLMARDLLLDRERSSMLLDP